MCSKQSSTWTSKPSAKTDTASFNSLPLMKPRDAQVNLTIRRSEIITSAAIFRKVTSRTQRLMYWCVILTSQSLNSNSSTHFHNLDQSDRASLSSTQMARLEVLVISNLRLRRRLQLLSLNLKSSSLMAKRLRCSLTWDVSSAKSKTVDSSIFLSKAFPLELTMKVSRPCSLSSVIYNRLMYNEVRMLPSPSQIKAMYHLSLVRQLREPSTLCIRSRWMMVALTYS